MQSLFARIEPRLSLYISRGHYQAKQGHTKPLGEISFLHLLFQKRIGKKCLCVKTHLSVCFFVLPLWYLI